LQSILVYVCKSAPLKFTFTLHFFHLADAFIQSDSRTNSRTTHAIRIK